MKASDTALAVAAATLEGALAGGGVGRDQLAQPVAALLALKAIEPKAA